jgi:hypothetical protein
VVTKRKTKPTSAIFDVAFPLTVTQGSAAPRRMTSSTFIVCFIAPDGPVEFLDRLGLRAESCDEAIRKAAVTCLVDASAGVTNH